MLVITNLQKQYLMGKTVVYAIRDVSLAIEAGDSISITGPSGAGKSTLLHLLGALQLPTSGHIEFRGRKIENLSEKERAQYRNEKIGFVFQNFHLQKYLNALENVALPLKIRGTKSAQRLKDASKILEEMGLKDRMYHLPGELSGGEQQRVAIARAIAGKPDILLADEPTGNLDSNTSMEIMKILTALNKQGITLVIVTHNPEVAGMTKKTICMKDGRIV